MSGALIVAGSIVAVIVFVVVRMLGGGKYQTISPAAAAELLKDRTVFLLDVRTKGEYRLGRIPGSRLVPLGELEGQVGQLPRDRKMVIYCASGLRSRLAARRLASWSTATLYNMAGGIDAWRRAGLPVER